MLETLINYQDVLDIFADLLKFTLPIAIILGLAKWLVLFVLQSIFGKSLDGRSF